MSTALHKIMKLPIKDFFNKCDQICSSLRIWSHLLKKSMESFIFCAVGQKEKIPLKKDKFQYLEIVYLVIGFCKRIVIIWVSF